MAIATMTFNFHESLVYCARNDVVTGTIIFAGWYINDSIRCMLPYFAGESIDPNVCDIIVSIVYINRDATIQISIKHMILIIYKTLFYLIMCTRFKV